MTPVSRYQGPIRLLLLDVDGVLTDGSLYVGADGESFKCFNVKDGLAVGLLRAHGIRTGILSGRSSAALDRRIEQLEIDIALTGRIEKRHAIAELIDSTGIDADEIAYVGDDVVDLPLIGLVGQFFAPSDAHPLVLQKCDHILGAQGGKGAVREAAEAILTAGGLSLEQSYEPLLNGWENYRAAQ